MAKRAAQDLTRILMRALFRNNQKGFSLIEMMVVLAIIGSIIALGLGRIRKRDNDIKRTVRQFYSLGKEIRNQARLKNSTFRLVIQMEEGAQKFWVESAVGFQGRLDPEVLEAEKNLKEEEKTQDTFEKDKSLIKKDKTLPDGLYFKSVESLDEELITQGIAYIYFFPTGFVEPAALQITNRKNATWTLIFHPLTGQADIIPEERSLRDVKRD